MTSSQRSGSRGVRIVFIMVLIVAALGMALLWATRSHHTRDEAATLAQKADAGPVVELATVQQGPSTRDVTLLGEAQPYQSTTLYGQVSGYLKTISVDRGDRVSKDQVLAEIASPQVDSQYQGAQASLANTKSTLKRTLELVDKHFIAAQTGDDARTAVSTAQAAVDNLRSQKSYEIIRAPFAGTVTARYVDSGALVQNASSSQTSALPIVTVADVSRLRVRVFVEQQDAAQVKIGDTAIVTSATGGDVRAEAKVNRTADQLDAQTRTMLTEIDIDNANARFVPGSFVNVTLHVARASRPSIPSTALVLHGQDTLVALVGDDHHVHLVPVVVAATDGATAEVTSGLNVGQRVAINANALLEGQLVRPAAPAK